ncbi:MAG: PDZ domain-containing protein, partial [Nitrospira sp.]|nr:PDZ domain-containing protein [Nitrospira sp.]
AGLDPEMLVTPNGRRLDLVAFGGTVFELTRVSYTSTSRGRYATITVPGLPPRRGIYHEGESFDRGRIRIKVIESGAVVLECDGEQQTFYVAGASPGGDGATGPNYGTVMVPPPGGGRESDSRSMATAGNLTAPRDPREEPGFNNDRAGPEFENGEWVLGKPTGRELPNERHHILPRTEYRRFVRSLPDYIQEIITGIKLDPDTKLAYGVEVLNISAGSVLSTRGLLRGDVIIGINEEPVRAWVELEAAVRGQDFSEEVVIAVLRDDQVAWLVFRPGADN